MPNGELLKRWFYRQKDDIYVGVFLAAIFGAAFLAGWLAA